jgi:hypothetical protein
VEYGVVVVDVEDQPVVVVLVIDDVDEGGHPAGAVLVGTLVDTGDEFM